MVTEHYLCAWSFETSVRALWHAAHAWRSIRTLRLVRLRQGSTDGSTNTCSLSSLPTEVFAAIEANIRRDAVPESLEGLPENRCACKYMYDEFIESDSTEEAFFYFGEEWGLSRNPSAMDELQCRNEFEDSEEYQSLWRKFEEDHAARPEECLGIDAGDRFWNQVSDYLQTGSYNSHFCSLDPYPVERLDDFLNDHDLQVWEVDDGLRKSDCLTVVFRGTIASRTKENISEETPFPYNRASVVHKRARIGLASPSLYDGQCRLKWVAKPDDLCSEDNPYCISSGESDNDDIISISSDD